MGLDNGIIIKCASKEEAQSIIDNASTHLNSLRLTGVKDNKVEVCYWRKCYNIKNKLCGLLHTDPQGGEFNIDLEDIKPIIKILANFLNKEDWEEDDYGSIWEFDEIRGSLFWNIMNLTWLYYYKMENPEIEIYFYDSF